MHAIVERYQTLGQEAGNVRVELETPGKTIQPLVNRLSLANGKSEDLETQEHVTVAKDAGRQPRVGTRQPALADDAPVIGVRQIGLVVQPAIEPLADRSKPGLDHHQATLLAEDRARSAQEGDGIRQMVKHVE